LLPSRDHPSPIQDWGPARLSSQQQQPTRWRALAILPQGMAETGAELVFGAKIGSGRSFSGASNGSISFLSRRRAPGIDLNQKRPRPDLWEGRSWPRRCQHPRFGWTGFAPIVTSRPDCLDQNQSYRPKKKPRALESPLGALWRSITNNAAVFPGSKSTVLSESSSCI